MIRRILLHIGGEKTGSTSIQATMAANRAALLDAGFAVPRAPGATNHIGLAAVAGDAALVPDLIAAFGGAAAVAALPAALAREIADLPRQAHTLLLSSEHCQSRLHDPAAIARLRDLLLAPLGGAVEVLIWLRRQDGIAHSQRNTWLRSHGALPPSTFPEDAAALALMDHGATLARWEAVFGRAALRPRLFEPGAFAGGDLLMDWRAACGILADLPLRVPPPLNRSTTVAAEALLALIPPAVLDRRPLFAWLERHCPGAGRRAPRAVAAAFLARFAAANEAVRRGFFPERTTLFDPDLSTWPERGDPPAPRSAVLALARAAEAAGFAPSLHAAIRHAREALERDTGGPG